MVPGLAGRARVIILVCHIRAESILKVNRLEGRQYFNLDQETLTVLVTGGSAGAKSINDCMLEVYRILAERLTTNRRKLQFIHLAGARRYDHVCQQMVNQGIDADRSGKIVIRPYLEEMEYGLAAADIMICRAGAATIAELTALGKPAILIPYPHAAGDHQFHNARYLVESGAAADDHRAGSDRDEFARTVGATDRRCPAEGIYRCGRGSSDGHKREK